MEKRPAKTVADFPPEILSAFDQYVHGIISRRQFLRRASVITASVTGAVAMLDLLNPQYANSAEVDPQDASIEVEKLIYPSPNEWQGYLAKPVGRETSLPAVLIIHENRGRNPYIEDVTRRLARAGFLAFAPDALTSFGGWPGNDDEGRVLQQKLDPALMLENWVAAFKYLQSRADGNGRVGALGFCYGGGVVNELATRLPDLSAGVAYYGRPAELTRVRDIKAPLQLHNGELDTRLMAVMPAYEAALKSADIHFESYVYAGAHHGFHNNTTPRFDAAAAGLAWDRTVRFFQAHLAAARELPAANQLGESSPS